jgi:hypothetical protein
LNPESVVSPMTNPLIAKDRLTSIQSKRKTMRPWSVGKLVHYPIWIT